MGIIVSEIDTSGRMMKSASPDNPALIRIHTENSSMKLRIRLLETPPKANNLLKKIYISTYRCGHRDLFISENGTLLHQTSDDAFLRDVIYIVNVFIHQSRVFYISREKTKEHFDKVFFDVLTDGGKFFTSLPQFFRDLKLFVTGADFLSYDEKLLFVSADPAILVISEDFFRGYEIIPANGYLSKYDGNDLYLGMKTVLIFQKEVVAITNWGAQFYDGQKWEEFEMQWGNLAGFAEINKSIRTLVVHTQNSDHLFVLKANESSIYEGK